MLVSVVLAAYNEENWIRTALDSLKQQTIPFELIIVDNESTDDTVKIAREYTSLVFSAPRGISYARNLGVLEASGDIIVFVDADCSYPPSFLETITQPFSNPDIVVVAGLFYNYDKERVWHNRLRIAVFYLFNYTPGCAVAYRRNIFLNVGGYEPINTQNFYKAAWWQLYQINWKMRGLGKFKLERSAVAVHMRPREACTVCLVNGPEALCKWCEEIGVDRF